jgi:hypothetical protein
MFASVKLVSYAWSNNTEALREVGTDECAVRLRKTFRDGVDEVWATANDKYFWKEQNYSQYGETYYSRRSVRTTPRK